MGLGGGGGGWVCVVHKASILMGLFCLIFSMPPAPYYATYPSSLKSEKIDCKLKLC